MLAGQAGNVVSAMALLKGHQVSALQLIGKLPHVNSLVKMPPPRRMMALGLTN